MVINSGFLLFRHPRMIVHQSRVDFEPFASRTTSTTATPSKPVNATVHQPLSSGKVAPKRPDSLIGTARKHHSATPNHAALTASRHACETQREPHDISIESKNGKLPSSSSGNKPAKRAATTPPPVTCHPLVISGKELRDDQKRYDDTKRKTPPIRRIAPHMLWKNRLK